MSPAHPSTAKPPSTRPLGSGVNTSTEMLPFPVPSGLVAVTFHVYVPLVAPLVFQLNSWFAGFHCACIISGITDGPPNPGVKLASGKFGPAGPQLVGLCVAVTVPDTVP